MGRELFIASISTIAVCNSSNKILTRPMIFLDTPLSRFHLSLKETAPPRHLLKIEYPFNAMASKIGLDIRLSVIDLLHKFRCCLKGFSIIRENVYSKSSPNRESLKCTDKSSR